jgi:hypothetical protein
MQGGALNKGSFGGLRGKPAAAGVNFQVALAADPLDEGDSDSDGEVVEEADPGAGQSGGTNEPAPEDEPAAEEAGSVAGYRKVLHFKPIALGGGGGGGKRPAGQPDSSEFFIPIESIAMVSFAGGTVLANAAFPVRLRPRKFQKETEGRTDDVPASQIKVVVKLAQFECALTRSGRVLYRNGTQKLGGSKAHQTQWNRLKLHDSKAVPVPGLSRDKVLDGGPRTVILHYIVKSCSTRIFVASNIP